MLRYYTGLFIWLSVTPQEKPPGRLYDQRHDQNDGGRDTQAERINLHDRCERRRALEHREDPGKPHTAYAHNRAGRGNKGYAKASQIAGQSLLYKTEQIRDKNIRKPDLPRGNDVRVLVKNAEQGMAEQQDQPAGNRGAHRALQQAKPHSFPAAVILSRAVILSDKGGTRLPKGIHDVVGENFQIIRGGGRRHDRGAKAVDRRLDNNVGKGKDHALHARRYAYFQNFPQHIPMYAQLPGVNSDHKFRFDQNRKQNHRADQIGEHRRRGDAVHIHTKTADKEQIEHDV